VNHTTVYGQVIVNQRNDPTDTYWRRSIACDQAIVTVGNRAKMSQTRQSTSAEYLRLALGHLRRGT
jgi:hypothetical protein